MPEVMDVGVAWGPYEGRAVSVFGSSVSGAAADSVHLLRADGDGDSLADTVQDLSFLDRCTCSATCTNLLTAPVGSPCLYLVELGHGDEVAIWLSLPARLGFPFCGELSVWCARR
ncbi:hypothetical protein [Actinomadura rudentiformis]|uniref:Uncharacterized protein n=1 Tax=Actinomadura rudentiformis TaxID=359158 RepID=A0A6H9YIU5_9ACTN|nr:hypothetical protein [Actinomadura rudentiformis]KAB2344134.1 hypothetical protein F8566_33025 [Actinomadura rudentiformis]